MFVSEMPVPAQPLALLQPTTRATPKRLTPVASTTPAAKRPKPKPEPDDDPVASEPELALSGEDE
jgi:hypothetical protein